MAAFIINGKLIYEFDLYIGSDLNYLFGYEIFIKFKFYGLFVPLVFT